jgi:hypothetical protein
MSGGGSGGSGTKKQPVLRELEQRQVEEMLQLKLEAHEATIVE